MMFTPCWPSAGPTGGAGVAWPAGSWSVNVLTSFFFGGMSLSWVNGCGIRHARTVTPALPDVPIYRGPDLLPAPGSDLGDLVEVQLDRRLPAEDRHQYLELLLVGIDLADRRRQGGEGAVGHRDRVAHLEVEHLDLRLRLLGLGLHGRGEPLQHLFQAERRRAVGPVGGAD